MVMQIYETLFIIHSISHSVVANIVNYKRYIGDTKNEDI